MGIIYCAKNIITEKLYIGQTRNTLKKRRQQHELSAKNMSEETLHYCRGIVNAIRKYGSESFEWSVLRDNVSDDDLDTVEVEEIAKHNSMSPNGYNLTSGGMAGARSGESRQRMKEYRTGRPLSEQTKKRLSESQKGRPKSEETRRRMSIARKGYVTPEETKEKLRAFGRTRVLSPEHKEKLREANTGKRHSAESLKKMSDAKKGKVRSESHCRNISKGNKGKVISEETKRRMSEAHYRQWETRRAKNARLAVLPVITNVTDDCSLTHG